MMVLVFDMDDTLYDQTVPFERACQKTFGSRFAVDGKALFVSSRKHSDAAFQLTGNKQMTMRDMYIYRISNAYKDFGISITADEALAFQEHYAAEQKQIKMTDRMQELLQWCSGKVTLGVISNGPSEHQWNKLRCLGVPQWIAEKHIFVSGECGYSKPDSRIFQLAEQQLGAAPDKIWYVGDSFENDIVGARQVGWNCIWLNRWQHPGDDCRCRCNIMVRDEEELIRVIHEIVEAKEHEAL